MPVSSSEVTIGRDLETITNGPLILTAAPGAGAAQNLFTITGGAIELVELHGIVTTAITASGTVIGHLQHLTLAGVAPGTAVDMCLAAAGLDIVAAINSQFTITGAVAAAMAETATGVVVAPSFLTNQQILAPGTIQLWTVDTGAMGDVAGAITWTIVYRPLGFGTSVVVA